MSQIAINTSQNVNIFFNTASIGERILAFIIDSIIKGAYLYMVFLFLFDILNLGIYLSNLDMWSIVAIISVVTLPIHLYTLVSETMMNGQTLGKRLMKIRVVKIDGFQANFGDYLSRWIFRLVDVFLNFGIVGILSMIISKNSQRLGDLVSGTAVISLKNKVGISNTILENLAENYIPKFPQVIALNDNDVRIIKENYTKANKTNDRIIISKLATKVTETLNLDPGNIDLTENQFIKVIISDYNYYTGKDL